MIKRSLSLPILLALAFLSLIPSASALFFNSYYSLSNLLSSDGFMVLVIFLIFYAVIIMSLRRTHIDKGPATLISILISLLISLAVYEKFIRYLSFRDQLSSWLLLIAVLIGMAFLLTFMYKQAKGLGIMLVLIFAWALIRFFDLYSISYIAPTLFYSEFFYSAYDAFRSYITLGILLVITFVVAVTKMQTHPAHMSYHRHP